MYGFLSLRHPVPGRHRQRSGVRIGRSGVLKGKFEFPDNLIQKILLLLQREANIASSQKRVEIHIKDQTDIPIINAATAAGFHVFVTGDKELQDFAKIGNLEILSPRKFWEKLKIQ